MLSKVLLNNVKQYKKRDASMDHYGAYSKNNQGKTFKLPQIATQNNNSNFIQLQAQPTQVVPQHMIKYIKSKCLPLEEITLNKKKSHSRIPSLEAAKPVKPFIEDPKERARQNLLSDYGTDIDNYLKKLSEINSVQLGHLSNHKINAIYRAKMIDWIVEVLTAFKCSE